MTWTSSRGARLARSLLLALAGANLPEPHPDSEEDGILTAEEIASLPLDGVDRVVLSACETGLRFANLELLPECRERGESTHPARWTGFVASGDWR